MYIYICMFIGAQSYVKFILEKCMYFNFNRWKFWKVAYTILKSENTP